MKEIGLPKRTNFEPPKMSLECLKRKGRTISVGWFMQELAAQGMKFLSRPDFCLLQTSHPLQTKQDGPNKALARRKRIKDKTGLLIPLSGLKSANNLRSLLLLVTRMLTISAGLFWFATNSCATMMIISEYNQLDRHLNNHHC